VVPLAGIEPALLAELDFESSASTNSATGAHKGIRRAPDDADYTSRGARVNCNSTASHETFTLLAIKPEGIAACGAVW
jgi:hypothetical protein